MAKKEETKKGVVITEVVDGKATVSKGVEIPDELLRSKKLEKEENEK